MKRKQLYRIPLKIKKIKSLKFCYQMIELINVNIPCEYITKKHDKKQEEQNIEKFEIITPLVKTIQLNNIEVVSSIIEKNNNIDTSNK